MSKTTHTLLFALMIPALATVAACNREAADGDTVTPAVTDAAPATDTLPVDQTVPPPADDTGMPAEDMPADDMAFADMDANQDGGVSMDELTPDQMLHEHFAAADADGNGKLSEAEITQHRADMGL